MRRREGYIIISGSEIGEYRFCGRARYLASLKTRSQLTVEAKSVSSGGCISAGRVIPDCQPTALYTTMPNNPILERRSRHIENASGGGGSTANSRPSVGGTNARGTRAKVVLAYSALGAR
jgi:hypothetical protein